MWLCLLLVSGVLGWSYACPSHECPCFRDTEIDCVDMYYKYVPEWFPENVTYNMLDLSKNKLRRVDAFAFKGIQVSKIRIRDNHGKTEMVIHPEAFRGLEEFLRVLTLKNSKVLSLPAGLFKGMVKLRQLDLAGNGRWEGGGCVCVWGGGEGGGGRERKRERGRERGER
jgi:hypothetical protein